MICESVQEYVPQLVCSSNTHTHAVTNRHTHARVNTHTHVHHACMHAYIHTCMHAHIHRYIHTYIHRDECNQAKFHPMKDAVSLAARPHCTAALLISRRGLHRLDRLLRPGFGEIGGVCPCAVLDAWPSCAGWAGLTRGDLTDLMMAEFCEEKLNCFKLRQPVFAQVLTRDELGRAMQCEQLDSLGGWWGSRALAKWRAGSEC